MTARWRQCGTEQKEEEEAFTKKKKKAEVTVGRTVTMVPSFGEAFLHIS